MNNNFNQLIEIHYFPCVNWFKISNNLSYINLFENDRWQKMSFRNRCVIAGSNGTIQLSAPVQGGRNQHTELREVKFDYSSSWNLIHWKSIISCYNKSPFFEYYADQLNFIFNKKYTFLIDMNEEIIHWLNKQLNDLQIIKQYELNFLKADIPYCSPKNYNQISEPVVYQQLFQNNIGFLPNLSVLDLLFMEGPNAKRLLL